MMLQAGLGVAAALAFVLALGAFCLWALKRWGTGTLLPRSRVPVEVVQRIALGPKVGIAVVRIGEKVMAVSVGDGGVRTLFELDEADRQYILSSSTVPTPMTSSPDASAAFATFLPSVLSNLKGQLGLSRSPSRSPSHDVREPTVISAALSSPIAAPVSTSASTNSDRDFRAMLGVSLSGATRLIVFLGAMVLGGGVLLPLADNALGAQVAPPVAQQAPQPPAPTAAQTAAQTPPQSPAVVPTVPQVTLSAEALGRVTPARPATPAGAAAQTPRKGNGASTTPAGNKATRPISDMKLDSATSDSLRTRAEAAGVAPVAADDAIMRMMPQMDMRIGDAKDGGLRLNGTVGIVVMMGLLTLLPTLLLMMTGFTRILIVLHFLKQAMGTQGAPPAQLLAGLALLLTGFVMAPTFTQINREAVTPWMDGTINQVEMMKTGVKPMRTFMLRQTRKEDLKTFVDLSRMPRPNTVDDLPLQVLMSAFVASELRTAFQIGFMIYLPFIIIDAVVASVLMSMGMMMLPPAMISLPFKLLLFVLVDGWSLTIQSLVQSFK